MSKPLFDVMIDAFCEATDCGPRMIQAFALGFLCNPLLWVGIHYLINHKLR